ncbi:MAG: type II secretion system protein [Phycisphaeraceae bacterium]|nr:MAG: type II secretion system protein [Phycisphaeraceae bacterium]
MHFRTPTSGPATRIGSMRAFTLIELLVVIGLIALLTTFLIVALSGAFGTARRASAESLVQTLGQGVQAFYNDFNFHPPLVIGQSGGGITTPEMQTNVANAYRDARAHSEWTLAIYLLGIGDINADGRFSEADTGAPAFGIRDPGRATRAWRTANQTNAEHRPPTTGRIYGPYVEPGSVERYLQRVRVTGTATQINETASGDVFLYRILDPFDVPVRYYHNWRFRDSDGNIDIRLAPVELRSADSLRDQIERGDANFDLAGDRHLVSSPFSILAAGDRADRFVDNNGNPTAPFGDVVLDPGTDARIELPYRYDQPITKADLPDRFGVQLRNFLGSNVRFAQ